MKIRKKIAMWISGTMFLAALIFSSIVFLEMLEQPFLLIDKELQSVTRSLVTRMETTVANNGKYDLSSMPHIPNNYWIKIKDNTGKTLYQSRIAEFTDILPAKDKTTYMVEKNIPRGLIWLDQDDKDDVFFRVKVIDTSLNGVPITVHIAKPIEKIETDIEALLQSFVIGLGLFTLVMVLVAYRAAGRIMVPVSDITALSKEISEKSLGKRIPLGTARDELHDLSFAMNKMFDRLQYSFQRQKEFIGNASHELKSPITRLILLQEDMLFNQNLPPAIEKGMIKQLDTTRRMSQLVKQLLDLSRLEQQETLKSVPVDLKILVDKALVEYTELFAAKNIRLENGIKKKLVLYGDPDKLFRLLINLVDNSIRYNLEDGGSVTANGWKTSTEIILELSNTGAWIPEKDLDLVFEQFYRVEKSRALIHGGSGLGLAIAKKIVQVHDGSIRISNEPDSVIKVRACFPLPS